MEKHVNEQNVNNKNPEDLSSGIKLCFSDKFFFALGAGDGDLALFTGNPYRLAASGTVKVLMLLVLQPLPDTQILPVFLVALIGVPGQHTEDHQTHQKVGDQGQHKADDAVTGDHG